ncbi:hypothetical protein V6Z11_A09G098800 [Gossypium hirsutum]|uniref:Uncharacterized protein isoform X2 n=1 Tax=Gossypium hirsutum TaxID=3635 RepID=A0ABM2YP31_GOSHI|nr:uncharacterized protein LOC107890281 isoform X2 [Gossypium hirsutum]
MVFFKDVDGNWHVGALASLLDLVGAITTFSYANCVSTVADFNASYYSTEHVEIESRVMADKGKLIHVVVQVRKKGNGEGLRSNFIILGSSMAMFIRI